MNQDEEHLRLLSIFHYVVGGITALFACLPCIHLGLGIALVSGALPVQPDRQRIGFLFGWLFIVVASVLILVGWTLAIAIINAGRCLARRTHYMRCFVVAGIECIVIPFGTVLGVFTIIVLSRPSVKALFQVRGRISRIGIGHTTASASEVKWSSTRYGPSSPHNTGRMA